MDKRVRSPNYPALSLPEAIEKIKAVYASLNTHGAPREVIAKAIGYTGLNGASATAISALNKYGLLDRQGDEHRVSDRARSILTPLSDEEKRDAIKQAAFDPPLFAELAEKFPGRVNEELLKNYLLRKGFAPTALSVVIQAYRDTSEMVSDVGMAYDSASTPKETSTMQHHSNTVPVVTVTSPGTKISSEIHTHERSIGRYDFEGGAYVRIIASQGLETEAALDMVEVLLDLKRKELARKKSVAVADRLTENAPEEDERS